MSIYQVLSYCLLSWFFMTLGVYLFVGLFGKKEQFSKAKLFKEFTLAYCVVMAVILFAAPLSEPLRQLLWDPLQGGSAIVALSVLLMLFYSVPLVAHNLIGSSFWGNNVSIPSAEAFLLFKKGNNEEQYLSIDVRDMASVLRAKRVLLAEVQDDETVLDATCRIRDLCKQGGHDLVLVNAVGVGYALRETLKTYLPRTPVVVALPSDPVSDCYFIPA